MQTQRNFLVGIYDDEDVLMNALRKIRTQGVRVHEVYSPFPVHGIDSLLGYKHSRLPRAAFFFGLLGTSLALLMQIGMNTLDWPMIVGGKPYFPLPTFIPVTFELTVLLASLGMVTTFLIASNLYPGSKKLMLDPRCTDNKFVLALDLDKNRTISPEALSEMLRENGATEINQKEVQL